MVCAKIHSLVIRAKREDLAIIQTAYRWIGGVLPLTNGAGCGKRLRLCQERVNSEHVRFEPKPVHSAERNTRIRDGAESEGSLSERLVYASGIA